MALKPDAFAQTLQICDVRNRHEQSGSPDAELAERREEIRRGLARSNTATGVALLVSVGLALAAILYALEAGRANERTREELWNAQKARAMALRLSGKVGRRSEGLGALTNAVSIRPSRELRDEAIATLALMDLQSGPLWRPAKPNTSAYAMSSSLRYYALGSEDGEIEVSSAAGGEPLLKHGGSGQRVCSIDFSLDERLAAMCWDSGRVELWDVQARNRVFSNLYPQREPNNHSIGFHPDSRKVAVACGDGVVRVVSVGSETEVQELHIGARPWAVAFDPSGTQLAVGVGRQIQVFSYPAGKSKATYETSDGVGLLAWHPFGQMLAAGSPNGRVTLLDLRTGRMKLLEAHTQRVIRLVFHPSGQWLTSASWDGQTRFWDAGSGQSVLRTQAGYALQFDSTGSRLGFFREGKGIGNWEIDTDGVLGTVETRLGSDAEVLTVALSHSGDMLAATTRDRLYLWEGSTGKELDSVRVERAWGCAFATDDGALFLSSGTGVLRVPLLTEGPVATPRFGKSELVAGAPKGPFAHGAITYGKQTYFGAEGASSHVFIDLAPPHTVLAMPGRWENSAPSIFDGRLASTSRWKGQGTRIWDIPSRKMLRALPDEGGISQFSPDGRWLVVGTSTEILIYDTQSWQVARRLPRDSASAISGLIAFSPDGGVLAVTHTLRQVRLLDPQTGDTLANLDAPSPERITAVAFSGDGSVLSAGTDNGVIQIWRLRDLRQRLAAMGLDWHEDVSNQMLTTANSRPLPGMGPSNNGIAHSRVLHGNAVWLSGVGASLALFFALYNIRHHRKLVTAYGTLEEIAAQRRRDLEVTQDQLLHSQKMKALGTLAAGIAHDFNNLLSIIRMSSQLVRRQLKPTGTAGENLDAIERAVGQGKNIVGSILGYTRRPGDPNQAYKVNEVVSETLAMLHAQYLGGVVLTLELSDSVPSLRGDKSRLEQILLNLIVNAREAMNGVGTLTLSVKNVPRASGHVLSPRAAASYVEVSVRDSGPGIPPETMPRIFEPFFTTKTAHGEHGSGLGLTTVYAIARQDGLGLAVESEFQRGATFRVFLPADKPDAENVVGAGCPST
jgi:signal transduction histidine kinase